MLGTTRGDQRDTRWPRSAAFWRRPSRRTRKLVDISTTHSSATIARIAPPRGTARKVAGTRFIDLLRAPAPARQCGRNTAPRHTSGSRPAPRAAADRPVRRTQVAGIGCVSPVPASRRVGSGRALVGQTLASGHVSEARGRILRLVIAASACESRGLPGSPDNLRQRGAAADQPSAGSLSRQGLSIFDQMLSAFGRTTRNVEGAATEEPRRCCAREGKACRAGTEPLARLAEARPPGNTVSSAQWTSRCGWCGSPPAPHHDTALQAPSNGLLPARHDVRPRPQRHLRREGLQAQPPIQPAPTCGCGASSWLRSAKRCRSSGGGIGHAS